MFSVHPYRDQFVKENPDLKSMDEDLICAFNILEQSLSEEGTVFTCGNGGSASDAEHIVGELLKSFAFERPIAEEDQNQIKNSFPGEAEEIIGNLESPLRAIPLTSAYGFQTAFANDVSYKYGFAQMLYGLGRPGDVLIAISTSGNSKNVVAACKIAKIKGIKIIGLTGAKGGHLKEICDVTLHAPANETHKIQEYHLPIYHFLCYALEARFFGQHGSRYNLLGDSEKASPPSHSAPQVFKDIKTIIFDFDGVMTDNRVYVTQDGTELVACNRGDGLGVKQLRKMGYELMVLSTEANGVVKARTDKLGIECQQNCDDKLAFLKEFCKTNNLKPEQLAYVGNDINDLEAMQFVGYSLCPADSHSQIKSVSDTILTKKGGDQIVRAVADFIDVAAR